MKAYQKTTKTYIVGEEFTARKMGSGSLDVLATPALIAFMENAALTLAGDDMEDESTTVGTSVNCKHLKASAVGEKVIVTAQITAIEGRKIDFDIEAKNEAGETIGKARHERFIVNTEKFMSKLKAKAIQ